MKTLLIAINSKYIHSNLAVYYLREYANQDRSIKSKGLKGQYSISICEYTINQQVETIFQSIYMQKPDLIAFSTYIWNVEIVERLCVELRKVLPKLKIWLGGPEVSYDSEDYLIRHRSIDGIMIGEGEGTFAELMEYYHSTNFEDSTLDEIKGIAFRKSSQGSQEIINTGLRPLLDFNTIPFPYSDLSVFENKIIYYESNRGCPFSCSYCLSSVDKTLRIRDIKLVKEELNFFLQHKVKQVKFVDRTFNCNKNHALAVWDHIARHDNGLSNFHFEIAGDILDDEQIQLLSTMRSGLVQLEIGVQSTNPTTIKAISRKTDLKKLSENVNKIRKARNVHQHLDLIAGLPYENYESFRSSFNNVYALKPDQLQLGFLKVLKGTPMEGDREKFGIIYKETPPYEVLFTKWISYDEILDLKGVEEMVETYFNSGQFSRSISFIEHYFDTPFDFFKELSDYYKAHNLQGINLKRERKYEILLGFMKTRLEDLSGFEEILMYDIFLRENLKARPKFASDQNKYKDLYNKVFTDKDLRKEYLGIGDSRYSLGKAKQFFHVEYFTIDVEESVKEGKYVHRPNFILFNYMDRSPIDYSANTKEIIKEGDYFD